MITPTLPPPSRGRDFSMSFQVYLMVSALKWDISAIRNPFQINAISNNVNLIFPHAKSQSPQ
jgi:hypothetical protein